jgi:MFS family permease
MMTQTYYLPFYFQAVRGTNPQTSGFSILPYGVAVSIATLLSGSLVTLSGFYVPLMWLGSGIFVAGGGLLYTLSRSSPFAKWFGYQVLTGVGYGAMVQTTITALQVVLSAEDIPLGSTLMILAQCLGGSVGLAVAENVFSEFAARTASCAPGG